MALVVKNPPANEEDIRDMGLIPGSERSPGEDSLENTLVFLPGEAHGQRSRLGCGVAEGQTQLSDEHYSLLPQNDFLEYLNK